MFAHFSSLTDARLAAWAGAYVGVAARLALAVSSLRESV